MMDDKYLAEIKARRDRAKTDEYSEPVYGSAAYYLIDTDIPALLSEVERLTARADQAALNYQRKCRDVSELEKDNAAKDQQITTLKADVERLTKENQHLHDEDATNAPAGIRQDQQIATLKAEKKRAEKALKLACAELNLSDVEKVFAPDYFVQQAQEQPMHESTHECDKSALEQEGKK